MNLLQYDNQVKELKLILNIVINIVDCRISKNPTDDVYSDIHTKLREIKNELDKDILIDEERKIFECLELIIILQLNKTDPIVFRLMRQIKNNYLQINNYQLNSENPGPTNLMH